MFQYKVFCCVYLLATEKLQPWFHFKTPVFKKNFSSFFWHYGVNKNCQGLPWTLGNLIVLHKKNTRYCSEGWRKNPWTRELALPGSLSCRAITAPAKAPAGRRDQQVQSQSSAQLLGPGNGHICEVTAASEKWGWGEGKDKHSFPSHFSLAAENWQSQLFLSSLPPSPVVLLMLLNRLEPVLCSLVPGRIWAAVLG